MQKRKKENVKNQIGINQTLTDKPLLGSSICNMRVQQLQIDERHCCKWMHPIMVY